MTQGTVLIPNYNDTKKQEYKDFLKNIGDNVIFDKDKWVCDKRKRFSGETNSDVTIYFTNIPAAYQEITKFFIVICLINGKTVASAQAHVSDLVRFFAFLSEKQRCMNVSECDTFVATRFIQYLDDRGFANSTKSGVWSSVNMFFKVMNGWDNMQLKNPFSIPHYAPDRKYDYKYIPDDVAEQLDKVFKFEEIQSHIRCIYWLLRLIPSRISEILGMKLDCLKRFNGKYVLFIPSWKQNGGRKEPVIRCIHLENTGIAGYLIDLIKKQQHAARQLQEYMPDNKKGSLLTYHQQCEFKGKPYYTRLYFVSTKDATRKAFQSICAKYNITDNNGQIYKVTSHQFRHNGITDRLAAGFTTAQIAEMTGHHGDAMIYNAYAHLNLLPETIVQKQEYVAKEPNSRDNRYILFGGRILNMEEQLEKRLLNNLRAHKVRGGICSDITGCKSDMWNCLDCKSFVPDAAQLDYYEEQAALWREKSARFSQFPIIRGNAEKNAELFEGVLQKLREKDGCLS